MSMAEEQEVRTTAERLEDLLDQFRSVWNGKQAQHNRRVLSHLRAIAELRYGYVFAYDAVTDTLALVSHPTSPVK